MCLYRWQRSRQLRAVPTPTPDVSIDPAATEIHFIHPKDKAQIIDYATVVIDQRHRKRKRAVTNLLAKEATSNVYGDKSIGKPKAEVVIPFDFTSEPNVLDDGRVAEQEDGRAGKRKNQKRGMLERGDLPAAPKGGY